MHRVLETVPIDEAFSFEARERAVTEANRLLETFAFGALCRASGQLPFYVIALEFPGKIEVIAVTRGAVRQEIQDAVQAELAAIKAAYDYLRRQDIEAKEAAKKV